LLHIQDSNTGRTGIAIDNTSTNGRNYILGSTGAVGSGADPGSFIIRDGDASSNRFVINSSGNVGIGATSPSNILHIKNADPAIRLEDSSPDGVYGLIDAAGGDFIISADGGAGSADSFISFRVDGTAVGSEKMRITSGGNVGIGTASPARKLHVVESSVAEVARLQSGSSTGGSWLGFHNSSYDLGYFGWGTTSNNSLYIVNYQNAPTLFYTNGTEKMRIAADGNVGIGTTHSGKKLNVAGAARMWGSTSNANEDYLDIDFYNDNTSVSLAKIGAGTSGGTSNGILKLYTSNAGTLAEALTILHDGNVGIGTTSPSNAKLQVAGGDIRIDQYALKVYQSTSDNFGDGIKVYYDNGNSAFTHRFSSTSSILELKADGASSNGLFAFASTSTSSLTINTPTSSSARIYLYSGNGTSIQPRFEVRDYNGNYPFIVNITGNVGVGTASPAYKLEVNGDFAATSKSFIIDHPTKPNKKLRYGSLEGPENGVYVRGRGDSNVIELPDYWVGLVHDDSITVQITAIGKDSEGKVRTYSVNDIVDNKVYIYTDSKDEVYNYFYIVNGERKDIDKLEVEIDK
jgi:hypothetical protein